MTGGKRKVRPYPSLPLLQLLWTAADNKADEPQPHHLNEFRIWSLRDGAKICIWIAHRPARRSIHCRSVRLYPRPGTYDDDSKKILASMHELYQLLLAYRNACRWGKWCTSGVFDSCFATMITSFETILIFSDVS
jgi:hypothetical protein